MFSQLGTRGIDLYAVDPEGGWHFCFGGYSFGSNLTTFSFQNLDSSQKYVYKLFLPNYDIVNTLKIGYESKNGITFLPALNERPIVTYGTSIMHGACPNRPGLSWVNWISRSLDMPVNNYGFQGQGMLEPEVIDLIIENDAQVYILDCLANLVFESYDKVFNLTVSAYNQIRQKWKNTPIILVEFSGYTNQIFNPTYAKYNQTVNSASKAAVKYLEENGLANDLYYISFDDLNIKTDDISDLVHPTDNGMRKQMNAIVGKLREILDMPENKTITRNPVPNNHNYNFYNRHNKVIEIIKKGSLINSNYNSYINSNFHINSSFNTINKRNGYNRNRFNKGNSKPRNAILGDSITDYWGGQPVQPKARGKDSWEKYMDPKGFINLGVSSDRIENCLWRVYHDEFYGYSPENIVTLIGTNNHRQSNEAIADGLHNLLKVIQKRQPKTNIVISGLLPRRNLEDRIVKINELFQQFAVEEKWRFINPGTILLLESGKINESLFVDGVHPNAAGYSLIAPIISDV